MSGTETITPLADHPDLVAKLLPLRRRNEPPRWEVFVAGEPVGRIEQESLAHARSIFYKAIAYYPGTMHEVSLELSTDFNDRCEAILRFRDDPESSPHIGWQRPPADAATRSGAHSTS